MARPTKSGPVRVLNTVVGQSPEGIALLFKRYGIQAPVTPENVLNALILYKRPFSDDLHDVVISTSNSDGSKDQFASIFNQVLGAATGIYTILEPIKAESMGISNAAPKTETPAASPSEPVKKIAGIPVALVAGIGAIVLLIIILLLIRKKS